VKSAVDSRYQILITEIAHVLCISEAC
jgi:hypothetical protein